MRFAQALLAHRLLSAELTRVLLQPRVTMGLVVKQQPELNEVGIRW